MVNSNTYQQNALEGFFQFSTIDQDRRKDAFKEGEAKGAYQKACETAKKLLLKGFSLYEIQDITGLSENEILKL